MKTVVDSNQLSQLVLKGYKSIAECDIKLGMLNVLIGANGAGKSNFIGFFKLIGKILDKNLQLYVGEVGGPDAILHFGRKKTETLDAKLYFGNNGYQFQIKPTQDNRIIFAHESLWWNMRGEWHSTSGHLATVLLQPEVLMPSTILIDEPELGLHPFAIKFLGSMMKSASLKHQIIVSTQSVELVNEFSVDDLIVVDKRERASTFQRPNSEVLKEWLEEYSLGDLWKKNILGGRPNR